MNVSVKKLPKSEAELKVELSTDELKPYLEQAARKISQETKISGFRPGKAPYDIVVREAGEMKIYQEASQLAVEATFSKAVLDNKLVTIGSPKISVEKIAPGNPFSYTATVTLLPEVELGDYKDISAAKKEVVAEEKDIDGTMSRLQRMLGKENRTARPVQKGDKVEIDMEGFVDKVPVDGGSAKGQTLLVGDGNFILGFEDNLIGMKENDKKEFELKFPKEYHRKDLAGKPVEFKVTMKSIFEIKLPELNDELAKMVGQFETLAALREDVKKTIIRDKETKERQRWELEIIDKIIKKSTIGELPEILIHSELHKMLHELEHDVSRQGMKFDDYLQSIKKTKDDLENEFRPRAVTRIKTAIILRTIADKENITISDDEFEKELQSQEQKYQGKEDVLKQIRTDEFRDYITTMLRSRKVFETFEQK